MSEINKELIENFRKIVLPFVSNRLYKTNFEGQGESDKTEFEHDFNEILDLAISALNPTGDLISRSALLNQIDTTDWSDVRLLVEDAQTVEITEEQAINKLHETGWLIEHDKEMTTRPQSEWEVVEGVDGDEYYECSNCGEPWVLYAGTPEDNNMNFCPNCGADMR